MESRKKLDSYINERISGPGKRFTIERDDPPKVQQAELPDILPTMEDDQTETYGWWASKR